MALLVMAVMGASSFALGFSTARLSDSIRVASQTMPAQLFGDNSPISGLFGSQPDGSVKAPDNFGVFWEGYELLKDYFDGDVPEGPSVTYAAVENLIKYAGACETDPDVKPVRFIRPRTPGDAPENFGYFWQSVNQLYQDCTGSVPEPDQLVYVALDGVIQRLDNRYTAILPPVSAEEFRIDIESGFEGIGATVEPADKDTGFGVVIVKPFAGSPAEKAGLKAGDEIMAVDGVDVTEMDLNEAVRLIRGPKDSTVALLIGRGDGEPFEVEVVRDRVDIPILISELRDDKILYIALADFSARAGGEVKKALEDGIADGAKGIIFDLRGNPGGRLDIAIDVASLFVEDGVVVSESGREEQEFKAKGKAIADGLPLAVLVDGASASASEIVAGAIQDYGTGVLVGEKTFGKGSVQRLFNLSDGSILRVTTARWFTPKGRQIDGEGLQPDIESVFEPDVAHDSDVQLDAAVKYLLEQITKSPASS